MLIGELSERAGISPRMLRHYDSIGLVTPTGRLASGYRDYTDADVARLLQVESLRSLGLSLHDVRRALDDPTIEPARVLDDLIERTGERIERDQQVLERLRQVRASDVAAWTDVADTVAMIRELRAADPSRRQRGALNSARVSGLADVLAEALLREDDPIAAGALRWALRRSGDEALSVLAPGLQAADPAVRRRAISALAELPSADATSALLTGLSSADRHVRRTAALALGRRGHSAAVTDLLDLVAGGVNDVEAAELLGGLARDHEIADAVTDLIADRMPERPPAVRLRLTQALAEIRGARSTDVLRALTDDADPHVAGTATYILTKRATLRSPD